MLQIIWGEDWQANRAALLAALCQPGDGQRIWIVPEQASFAAEQQLCRLLPLGAVGCSGGP